jgi:hypothetical protein
MLKRLGFAEMFRADLLLEFMLCLHTSVAESMAGLNGCGLHKYHINS